MKRLVIFALAAFFAACTCDKSLSVIETAVPVRPAGQTDAVGLVADPTDPVRVGFLGLGMRGPGAVYRFTHIPGVKIVALCDVEQDRVSSAQDTLKKAGLPEAAEYSGSTEAYKALCERDDIDLVYVATDWIHHAPIGVYAMEHGKHVAIEVPAAMTLEEIWQLVDTAERTRKHCMQLENCVYDFFELTTLNMAQNGVFGELLHVEGSYIHNLADYWGDYWNNWRLDYNRKHRGDVYPTHGFGPACQLLDIHRGDRLKTLVAMDTKSVNGAAQVAKMTGEPCDDFKNADHTLTMIGTEKGKTILIEHNVMTPRPYSRMYQVTGTEGFANKYPVKQYCIGEINPHRAVSEEDMNRLMNEYKHPIHLELDSKAKEVGGHGGMDFIMDYRLVYCLRNGLPLDMDVYDLAEWCGMIELSRISLENGSMPVAVPDFTRGGWDKVKGYRHAFVQ